MAPYSSGINAQTHLSLNALYSNSQYIKTGVPLESRYDKLEATTAQYQQQRHVINGGDINVHIGALQSFDGVGYDQFRRVSQHMAVTTESDLATLFLGLLLVNGIAL